MAKSIKFKNDSLNKLMEGSKLLADAVGTTLGPAGKYVMIQKPFKDPHVTKDGVSVAREVESSDDVQNMAIELIRSAANKTADEAGDATTTTTVLANALIQNFAPFVSGGINVHMVKKYVDECVDYTVTAIKKKSKQVKNQLQLEQIATISANGDKEIGKIVSEAVYRVGKYGVVSIEESTSSKTYTEIVDGIQYSEGYTSAYFATDGAWKAENALVLIYNGRIHDLRDIQPQLLTAAQGQQPILILCNSISAEAEATLIKNKMAGKVNACVTSTPGHAAGKAARLEDIATVCNATVIRGDLGEDIPNTSSILGLAKSVIVYQDVTTITADADKEKLNQQIERLVALKESSDNMTERNFIDDRIASLSCAVAVIKVGGFSEAEVKEKMDRIEDAVCAAKSALQEGIVPGGGITLLDIATAIRSKYASLEGLQSDVSNTFAMSIEEPFVKICANADMPRLIDDMYSIGKGYNVFTGEINVDMVKKGIVDPAKVTRCSVLNATSVAMLILMSGCTITGKMNHEMM